MTGPIGDRLAEGLRRNAAALVGGGALLAGLWLLPDLTPAPDVPPPVELTRGRIVEFVEPDPADPLGVEVRIRVVGGPADGEILGGFLQGPAGQQEIPDYEIGDDVVVSLSREPTSTFVAVSDRWRVPLLAGILGLFAAGVAVVGGWRGIRSLLALALTLGVVGKVVVPLLLAGWNPLLLAVGAATVVTLATFLLTEGLRRTTFAAATGTFVALALTSLLALAANGVAEFTEFQGSEAAVFLQSIGREDLDLGGLLLAAIIFGALGVLDDVTVTQAATVNELHDADPAAGPWRLFTRSMNVGRSHIAATVNTLVLAYVGASLPLLVLFAAGRQDPLLIASGEAVAVEIVKALAGSIGIVAAVPLTSAVAVLLVGRRLPMIGDGAAVRRAPGWD